MNANLNSLAILFFLLLFSSCKKKDDDFPDVINLTACMVDESGSQESLTSTDPTVTFSNDTTEIDNSFTNNRWLWFQVDGQTPGTYALSQSGDRAIFNNSSNVEFSSISGTITFTEVNVTAKKIKGTFDNMKLVSGLSSDTVSITNGTFDIDN